LKIESEAHSPAGEDAGLTGTFAIREDCFPATGRTNMARKYSRKASADVERVMKKRKAGTLKSGRSGRKVTSRKQAIAIGLSEARAEGKKVPKKAVKKKTAKKKRKKAKNAKRRGSAVSNGVRFSVMPGLVPGIHVLTV
jgi:hypothetical protein